MGTRVTMTQLEAVVKRINRMTNSPETSWVKGPSGKHIAQIGNYHLDGAYGGWALHRMVSEGGAITDVFKVGHVSKREILAHLFAFIAGLEAGAS